jgi:EAL and modified HD-GYP domain-containing signal transduction protein
MRTLRPPSDTEAPAARVLLSRQPIYRANMNVFGYELLFRYGNSDHADFSDGAKATAQVIVNALMEIGLDAMVGRHLAFINFERTLLMGDYCDALPAGRVVLEILETVEPDTELLQKLERLRAKGYRIALDDFVCADPYLPLLELADFVKLDVRANSWEQIERAIAIANNYPVELLAEKVEQLDQVERCKRLGFRYFQGYFFCRPQNMTGRPLPPNRLATMHLLAQLNRADIKLDDLEHAVSQDLSLSYKLLRYINSAMCSLDREVESIRHATVLVGLEKMRIWASLLVFSGFGDSSHDVVVTGAVRARMCELIAVRLCAPHPERYFLAGLFSVLDAILDRPMEEVLSMIALSSEIKAALLGQAGELGNALHCVQAFERREWDQAKAAIGLEQECIEQTYQEALAWSARMIGLSKKPTQPTR